jgi:ChpA-C
MHGIAKRGLALVAATSGLVLGTAAIAAADASTTADTSHSGGAVAGWTAQVPANVPVKLCGVNVQAVALKELPKSSTCHTGALGAVAKADADHSGGIVSGNVAQVAGSVPVLFCGWNVDAVAFKDMYDGSTCTANTNGPGASATADADHSGGIGSGNVAQVALNVPIDFCGNNVTAGTVKNVYEGSTCSD